MDIFTHLVSFLAGLGAGWALKIYISSKATNTRQTGNIVGGDMAGGDIQKRK